jgi:hypothetical protein
VFCVFSDCEREINHCEFCVFSDCEREINHCEFCVFSDCERETNHCEFCVFFDCERELISIVSFVCLCSIYIVPESGSGECCKSGRVCLC